MAHHEPTLKERAWTLIARLALELEPSLPCLAPGQVAATALASRLIEPERRDLPPSRSPGADVCYRLLGDAEQAGLMRRVSRLRWGLYSDVAFELTEAGLLAARRTVQLGAPAPADVISPRPDWQRQAWTACRIAKQFSAADVARTVEGAGYDRVYRYLLRLVREGYLMRVGRQRENGQVGSYALFRLRKDIGPEPPIRYGPQAKTRTRNA